MFRTRLLSVATPATRWSHLSNELNEGTQPSACEAATFSFTTDTSPEKTRGLPAWLRLYIDVIALPHPP